MTARRLCARAVAGAVLVLSLLGSPAIGPAPAGSASAAEPTTSPALSLPAATVVTGRDHSCAIIADGTVSCWGANTYGQLGRGTKTEMELPGRVVGIAGAVALSVADEFGETSTCALTARGKVACWGDTGGETAKRLPFSPAVRMSRGGRDLCVVTRRGEVECEPGVPLPGIADAADVAVGGRHGCALTNAGDVLCWGNNRYGQVGSGLPSLGDSAVPPTRADLDVPATAISAGEHHTCATLADGGVRCWGANEDGQLGNGSTDAHRIAHASPSSVIKLTGHQVSVTTSASGTCTTSLQGAVYCWGRVGFVRAHGTDPGVPSRALDLHGVAAAAVSADHGCAALSSGAVKCGGSSYSWQTGRRIPSPRPTVVPDVTVAPTAQPAQDPIARPASDASWVQIATGQDNTCGVKDDATVWCWGRNALAQQRTGDHYQNMLVPTRVRDLPAAKAVSVGAGGGACAIDLIGRLFCWGRFGVNSGLGEAGVEHLDVPQLIDGVPPVRHVSVSAAPCAITVDDALYCWGYGPQTGFGTRDDVGFPRRHDRFSAIADVDTANHTCASSRAGTMWCWGSNLHGQIGNGTTSTYGAPHTQLSPYEVDVSGVVDVAAGDRHSCALVEGGVPWCWGSGTATGRPAGDPLSLRTVPGPVRGVPETLRLSTPIGWHQCAETVGDELWCWGDNLYQQLGSSTGESSASWTPLRAPLPRVQQAQTGLAHSCTLTVNNALHCWGHNIWGQIGNGVESEQEPITRIR